MIVPNKYSPLEKTVLGKLRFIIALKDEHTRISIMELYRSVGKKFDCIDEFLYALDVLFLLEKINVDFAEGVIEYVD